MKTKKRHTRSFFPLLLLLTLSLAAVALLPRHRETAGEETHGFVLLLEGIDESYEPHLHVGDRMIDRRTRRILGDISAVASDPAMREIFSEAQGKITAAAVPGKRDVRLTVTAAGNGTHITTEAGDVLRIGQVYHFRTYGFTGEGRVIALI